MDGNDAVYLKESYLKIFSQALQEKLRVRTVFSGRSMSPTLTEGMMILAESIDPSRVKPADIILYKRNGQIVGHRVIRVLERRRGRIFVTKGDNHIFVSADRVREDDLLAIVTGAFFEDRQESDILIRNNIVGSAYVVMGNMAMYAMALAKHVPWPLRPALGKAADGLFLLFKKLTHALYIGNRYARMFFGRRPGASRLV